MRPSVEQYALGLGPYASELTRSETISPDTFARLQKSYSEREICDIVWLVASEHLYNVTNRGLGIGSDELCELSPEWTKKRPRSLRGDE